MKELSYIRETPVPKIEKVDIGIGNYVTDSVFVYDFFFDKPNNLLTLSLKSYPKVYDLENRIPYTYLPFFAQ